MLTCDDIAFAYEGREVLSDVSFSVADGDSLCIVGQNGSGKSTLLKGILGLKAPTRGKLTRSFSLQQAGYLPQQADAQKTFPASVFEVVLSGRLNRRGLKPFYTQQDKQCALRNIKRLGMAGKERQNYGALSGGQQQRVLLARALCAAQDVLILDEPVSGLDPAATQDLYAIIRDANRQDGMGVIMVSHDIQGALATATHILQLGNPVFFGRKEDYLHAQPGIQEAVHNA